MGCSVSARRFVLVVEDEPILRMNATDMFVDVGYEVIEAENADAALRLLEIHEHEVVDVFTDAHMPGSMDGLDLTRIVHERWPHILPVVTSGRERLRDDDIPNGGCFIAKPYRLSKVVGAIRQKLWGERRGREMMPPVLDEPEGGAP
jgi:two-component system, response regulator PdtaR